MIILSYLTRASVIPLQDKISPGDRDTCKRSKHPYYVIKKRGVSFPRHVSKCRADSKIFCFLLNP